MTFFDFNQDIHSLYQNGVFSELNTSNYEAMKASVFRKFVYYHLSQKGFVETEFDDSTLSKQEKDLIPSTNILRNGDRLISFVTYHNSISTKLNKQFSRRISLLDKLFPLNERNFIVFCPFHYNGKKIRSTISNTVSFVDVPLKDNKLKQICDRYLASIAQQNISTTTNSLAEQLGKLSI
ncbi:MAG: hypothetical protein VX028_01390 [Nanoarchaeota archaeon]|nr:hypothetical protein [Nanoarchaeota archaeon]